MPYRRPTAKALQMARAMYAPLSPAWRSPARKPAEKENARQDGCHRRAKSKLMEGSCVPPRNTRHKA